MYPYVQTYQYEYINTYIYIYRERERERERQRGRLAKVQCILMHRSQKQHVGASRDDFTDGEVQQDSATREIS